MRDLPHLRLTDTETTHDFRPQGGGGGEFQRPPRDRAMHAAKLQGDIVAAEQAAQSRGLLPDDPMPLTYELQPQAIDIVQSLERQQSGIVLLSVAQRSDKLIATVRVPPKKLGIVKAILDRYATEIDTRSQRPKNQDLVESIDQLWLATEQDLWTDSADFPAADKVIWWEVWLYHDNAEQPEQTHERFAAAAAEVGFDLKPRRVAFPDRVVVLAYGTFQHWQADPRLFLSVAELRKAKELASDYVDIEPRLQAELVAQARKRIKPPPEDAPATCLLDTGVDRQHPLLQLALAAQDTQTLDPHWGTNDHDPGRHGTTMAGLALYGPLTDLLASNSPWICQRQMKMSAFLPNRNVRFCVPVAMRLPGLHIVVWFLGGTFSSSGETEAGSAGEQPAEG